VTVPNTTRRFLPNPPLLALAASQELNVVMRKALARMARGASLNGHEGQEKRVTR
jgi:hypothetical protein